MLGAVLRNGALFRLQVVWASVTLVRWALAILVGLYAFRAGGAAAVGLIAVARIAPAALLASRLALAADRHSRRLVLAVSVVVRLALTTGMALAVLAQGPLWLVGVLAAGWSVADAVHKPAQLALTTTVARTPGELAAANALWSMVDNAGFLAASLAVGVTVSLAGLGTAFVVCTVPLVLGLVALLGVPADPAFAPLTEPAAGSELLAGLRTVAGVPDLRILVGLQAANLFVQAMLDVMVVVIAVSLLAMGEQGAGWLNSAWGVGGIAGGVVATTVLAGRGLPAALRWGLVLVGLPLIGIAVWPDVGVASGGLLVVGLGFGMVEVSILTLGQRLVACDVMARVYGVEETLTIVAMAVGSITASSLVHVFGERGALAATGAVLPLVAITVWRRLRRFTQDTVVDDAAYGLVRGVPAFAHLPVCTLETLASRARRVQLQAGADIVRQGDAASAFFIIERGDVEVFENDSFRRTEGPGEHFGEIALLRDVTRTATVRAKSQVSLLVLDRTEFLTAVGAHARARQSLQAVAGQRLGYEPT